MIRQSRRFLRRVVWASRLSVSAIVLVAVLAVLATIPLLNIYVLGYFLEAEGRIGRGERWRHALPWVRNAPRIAAIAVGTVLVLLPLMLLADVARDAELIDPTGQPARLLRATTIFGAAFATVYLVLAYVRGGALWSYLRPIKNARVALQHIRAGSFAREVSARITAAWSSLQILSLFWIGARGLAVALAWLFVPCAFIAASGPANGGRVLLKLAGVTVLALVFPALLILQAHFAVNDRLRAGFAVSQAFKLFGRAPFAWLTAGTITAALALPLFLFKIVAPPRDALWLLTPLFVSAMLPARIITGWAYRRAIHRQRRRSLVTIGLAAAGLLAVGLLYSTGVFASQYINEHGRHAVFEQHAFSLPVPF